MTKSTITISVTDAEGHDITDQFDLVAARELHWLASRSSREEKNEDT